jgi:hypothetical protein
MRDYEKVRDISIEKVFVDRNGMVKKYPFRDMQVGDVIFIDKMSGKKKNLRSYVYARGVACRKKFSCSEFNMGMQVTCIGYT